jgi:hypothetical protein
VLETLALLLSWSVNVVMAGLVAQNEVVQLVGATVRQLPTVVDVQRLAIEQVGPTHRASPGLVSRQHLVRRWPRAITQASEAVALVPVRAEPWVIGGRLPL